MKLKDIIMNASVTLGLQDVSMMLEREAPESELLGNTNFNLLFRCANLVAGNIASNYVDTLHTEILDVVDGVLEFSAFTHRPLKIRSVVVNGMPATFELFMNNIRTRSGRATVTYAFVPSFKSVEDDAGVLNVSEHVITFGVLAEFAFVSGMFNEARVFNERFEHALFSKTMRKNSGTLPRSFRG